MKFIQFVPANTNIDFIGKFKFFATLSAVAMIVTFVLMFTKGFNFGIDFTGGTVVQVQFTEPTNVQKVREIVEGLGEEESSVVAIGTDNKEFLITVRTLRETTDQQPLDKRLLQKVGTDKLKILQMDIVGPKVGKELKKSAILAMVYSLILIAIYIWFRFDLKFAPGAALSLLHDMTFVAGFYVVTGRQFTIAAVAAILTTAGYSINDTIVIYDRVREMLKTGGEGMPLAKTINSAINLTLSRTLLTNFITFLSIVPIAIFCSGEIGDFAESMIVGMIVGTYSTVYIASPFTILYEHIVNRRKAVSLSQSA